MEQVTAIFIPSLNRPHKIEATVKNIQEVTPEPHVIYYMVSDDKSKEILEKLGIQYFWDQGGDTRYVTRMNHLYEYTVEPVMFMGSDDVIFHKDWLTNALNVDSPVTVVNDTFNPQGTQALIKREYIDTQSGCIDVKKVLFFPGYMHQYADTEQFAVARKRGVLARAMDSIVEHKHFVNSETPVDPTYTFSMDHETADHRLFNSRRYLWES